MSTHIIIAVTLCAATCQPAVLKVWDGDSLRVEGQEKALRILNIDAPELDGRCAYETELADRARNRLAELLGERRVVVRSDRLDKYGRALVTLSVNGQDIGDQLVHEGLARTWTGRRQPWC